MLKRATARTKQPDSAAPQSTQQTQPLAAFPPTDESIIQRTRLKIPNAHIFKLPPKPHSGGWRGADWRDKVWQGSLQVVERGDETAVLLADTQGGNIFAVCPIRHFEESNGVDRCIDSSRYFVLRIQNSQGRHMFIGLAFNERNDAFDFNTALEDSKREKEMEKKAVEGGGRGDYVKSVDYKMKEGEKIRVSIPKVNSGDDGSSPTAAGVVGAAARRREAKRAGSGKGGGFLAPSSKDTPSRMAG